MKRITFFTIALMLSIGATIAQDMGFVGTWGFSNDGTGGVLAWGTQDKGAIIVPGSATISGTTYTVTGIRHDFGDKCVNNYPGADITSVQLPEGIISIGDVAFYGFTKVTTFNIPSTVTSFGTSAFEVMYALTTINSAMTTPVAINASTLFYATDRSKVTLHIPFGKASVYASAGWTGFGSVVDDIGAPSITVPDAPTGISAVSSNAQATISFTPPSNNGGAAITGYTVTSNPGSISQSGVSSPITVIGLTNGTAYTFTVVATNSVGNSSASSASNSVTPSIPSFTPATNVALGKTVTVSGGTASGAPSNLVDGILNDNNSRWRGDNTCTVDIDFGTTQTLSSIYINSGYTSDAGANYEASSTLSNFMIQYWNGSSWTTIPGTSITGNTNPNLTLHFSTLVTTTKIRLNVINGSTDNSNTRLYEIKVWTPINVPTSTSISSIPLTSASDIAVGNGALLTIDIPTTINNLFISAGGQVTNTNSLTASSLIINSDGSNGTGTYVETGTSNITTANVNQYLTSGRNWYISSPVTGAKSDVLSATAQNPVYWYDEVHGTSAPWSTITNTTSDLNVMQGYVANLVSNGIVTFSGALNTGAKSIIVSRTAGQTKEGFNLVGNPYPSYLDWSNVTKTNLLTTMWYRTKSVANAYVFDTYNASGGIGTSLGAKAVTNLIPPLQAFWVRVDQGQTSGTFSVTNSHRAHADNGSNTFKSKSSLASSQPVLRLEVSNGISIDQALVYFNASASNSYDNYDSPKMPNEIASTPEIYTLAGTEQVVINGVKDMTQLTLGFTTREANNFTIKASQFVNFASGTQILLRDNLLNNEQDLTLSDYNFYSDVTVNNETRFTVLFKAPSVATGINHNSDTNVWISLNGNKQIVVNGASGETKVTVYNAIGQKIASSNLTNTTKVLNNNLVSGVYTVAVTNAGKTITRKIIID